MCVSCFDRTRVGSAVLSVDVCGICSFRSSCVRHWRSLAISTDQLKSNLMPLGRLRVDQRRGPKPACPDALRGTLFAAIKHGSRTGCQAGAPEQGASLRQTLPCGSHGMSTCITDAIFCIHCGCCITSVIRTCSLQAFFCCVCRGSTALSHHVG